MPSQRDIVDSLYRNHQSWLQGWLAGRIGCREVAADLSQDTFARLLVGRELADLHEPRAFLTTVAKGVMANWWRRQTLERAYLDYLSAQPEACVPSVEQQMIVREALQQVDAMLDQLPRQARQVFLLSQFDGLGYSEIAARLEISLSTVKRHMKRAFLGCLAYDV